MTDSRHYIYREDTKAIHMRPKEYKFHPMLYTWREFCISLILVMIIIWLTGCTQLSIVRTAIDVKGQEAADRILADTEFVMCRGISVGAWVRRFGRDPALAEAWKTICGSELLLTTPK